VLFVSENRSNAHRENPYSRNPVNLETKEEGVLSKVKTATFVPNDNICPAMVLPLMISSLSNNDIHHSENDGGQADYATVLDTIAPTNLQALRNVLLAKTDMPSRKKKRLPVQATLNAFDVAELATATPVPNNSMYISLFPMNNVVHRGLTHYYAMAATLDSVDLNMTKPIESCNEASQLAVPFRVAVSHEGLESLNNSYNNAITDCESKYANDEVFDTNSIFRMMGHKFSKDIFIMPCNVIPTFFQYKRRDKSADWKQIQILNFMDKMFYCQTLETSNQHRPSLLDVGCIIFPIVGSNHFSVAAVMNIHVITGREREREREHYGPLLFLLLVFLFVVWIVLSSILFVFHSYFYFYLRFAYAILCCRFV
jgi:hypothetical protein